MSRMAPVLLIAMFLAVGLATIPQAQATHMYGHQFMVVGRIIGADGEPAEHLRLTVTVDTTKQQDPYMTIRTDCHGIFYTNNALTPDESENEDGGLEASQRGEVMHIHTGEYRTRGEYHILTQYGNFSARADSDRQAAVAKFQLDETPPQSPECEGSRGAFHESYTVAGRLQRSDGGTREDLRTIPDQGQEYVVNVTIQTEDGPVSREAQTTAYADYIVSFANVTVRDGAQVTARWQDTEETGEVDTKYRLTSIHLLDKAPIVGETTRNIFLGVIGAAIVIGLVVWGYSTAKDKAELRKAQSRSGRKRANK